MLIGCERLGCLAQVVHAKPGVAAAAQRYSRLIGALLGAYVAIHDVSSRYLL
jgi:hypothetical protein